MDPKRGEKLLAYSHTVMSVGRALCMRQKAFIPGKSQAVVWEYEVNAISTPVPASLTYRDLDQTFNATMSTMDIDEEEQQHPPITICPHFASVIDDPNAATYESFLSKYKLVNAWGIKQYTSTSSGSGQARKRRKISPSPICGTCTRSLHRPFPCMHCDYVGCWTNDHINTHLDDSDHTFCVDVRTGGLYCSKCDSYVYHQLLEETWLLMKLKEEERYADAQLGPGRRVPFQPWQTDTGSLEDFTAVTCQARRGLLNLGQTCFLNTVLQALIHNPLLRNFFLADKHNHGLCNKGKECTCCEMDKLFGEIFSGESSPFAPAELLLTTWRTSSELAGYAQQDAHECFMAMLNQIHTSSRGSTNISCNCIIHSTFQGFLQSDVKCERCGNVTTAVDPMLDISLELRGKGGAGTSGEENSLTACLQRYTSSEKLGLKDYSCAKCGKASHDASKRLSIKQLPSVLSFQFKRFEQTSHDKAAASKIATRIRFPEILNMAPYTTLYMTHAEKENDGTVAAETYDPSVSACSRCSHISGFLSILGPTALYEYELFAVINHEGQLNNGHYTNFARYQDQWYRFDDDKVTLSSSDACIKSSAYMCFYVKRHFEYKPFTVPTYVKRREDDALKERELELERMRTAGQEKEKRDQQLEADLLAMIEE
ncbi:hypothetical protein BDV98DRAFT_657301 [Pterulicium gracile]|uniref:Uncharacterized protein n=1 Tax=Pterulicium gracile TaxID=1884261 RepID=A0A5C3QEH6_9AGAR|nr:hypothetical protein BDV98DRAFT_657301 [Pterula gracilis]